MNTTQHNFTLASMIAAMRDINEENKNKVKNLSDNDEEKWLSRVKARVPKIESEIAGMDESESYFTDNSDEYDDDEDDDE